MRAAAAIALVLLISQAEMGRAEEGTGKDAMTWVDQQDNWAIAEGRTEEYTFQVRFRRVAGDAYRRALPKRLNIFWAMSKPDSAGMASREEIERLHAFEDRLLAAVEPDGNAILAVVLTGRGEREFVFYVRDPQEFMTRLSAMPQEESRYPIEVHLTDDPDWEYYTQVVPK